MHHLEYLDLDSIQSTAQDFLDHKVLVDNYLFKFI